MLNAGALHSRRKLVEPTEIGTSDRDSIKDARGCRVKLRRSRHLIDITRESYNMNHPSTWDLIPVYDGRGDVPP